MLKKDGQFKAQDGTMMFFIAVVALLLCQILAFLILQSVGDISNNQKETLQTALAIIFQVSNLTVFFAYILSKKTCPDYFLQPKNSLKAKGIVLGAAFGILCLFLFMGIANLAQNLLEYVGYTLAPPYVNGIIAQDIFLLLNTVILAPIGEELIFRSGLLSGLKKQFGDITCSILVGLAFALVHLNPEQTVYQFFLGFGASMLVLSTGWIVPAIVMHLVSNLLVALAVIGLPALTSFFDWYFVAFTQSTVGIIISGVVFPILGVLIFTLIAKLVKNNKGLGGDFAQTEPTQKTNLKISFYKKNSFSFVYGVSVAICLLLWGLLLFQNING